MQERPNSIDNTLELRLSCTNPLICKQKKKNIKEYKNIEQKYASISAPAWMLQFQAHISHIPHHTGDRLYHPWQSVQGWALMNIHESPSLYRLSGMIRPDRNTIMVVCLRHGYGNHPLDNVCLFQQSVMAMIYITGSWNNIHSWQWYSQYPVNTMNEIISVMVNIKMRLENTQMICHTSKANYMVCSMTTWDKFNHVIIGLHCITMVSGMQNTRLRFSIHCGAIIMQSIFS